MENFGRYWFSSGEHGSGAGAIIDGEFHPYEATFSFIGDRGYHHDLIIEKVELRNREYECWHAGRRQRGRATKAIEPGTPWSNIYRIDARSLNSDRRYEELKDWLLSRPVITNTQIMELMVRMSEL